MKMTQAYFSQIKAIIMQYIEKAQFDIYIAVAWFTHRDLFHSILNALDRNIRVYAILIDDIINRGPNSLDFSLFIAKGGKLRFMNSRNLLMHNKFSLFDNKLLITGSYNWTYSAELKNAENIIVTTDEGVCQAFRNQFDRLWKGLNDVKMFIRIDFNDIESATLLNYLDNMRDEYDSMEQFHVFKPCSVSDIDSIKNNICITKLNTIVTNTKRSKPVVKKGICLELINNMTKPIVLCGQELPFTHSVDARTSYDYQTAVECNIRNGNYSEADKNELLVQIKMEDLPKKKAGEVTFQTKVTIDTNGYMHIEFLCVNTGLSKSAIYNAVDIIEYC